MSLLGAMNTAISGLTAQSASFTNISENVANSQTDGYKEVDTNFSDLLTVSNATENLSGSVLTSPGYTNTVQGTVVASSDPLAMAISGQGFFPVSVAEGTASGVTSFNPQPYYTRNGDFTMNADGYLTNSAGYYLNGWSVDPTTGVANQTTLAPVQISQSEFNPVATTQLTLSANLPATPSSTAPISSQVEIYDALGTEHTVDLDWTQNSTNNWTVSINVPDNTSGASVGTANVLFGSTSGNGVPEGTVGAITGTTGSLTGSSYAANTAATLGFTVNFGSGPQAIQLGMGTYGSSSGLTQYAGTTYSLEGLTQNGVPPGSFQSVTAQANGDVVVNYNNGQTRTVAQIPIVTFNAADQLQSQNGQAYTATAESGTPMAQQAGTSGAGSIVTGSVEDSNVDLATQLSQLIVAQQAYSANAKVITASNQLLQTTIDMKQ
jgi:flagellar hook protein FlgE